MNARLIRFAVSAVVIAAGCSACGRSDNHELQVSLTFDPNPIRLGTEHVVATVLDSAGTPVSGASVTVISSMPAMKMNIPMRMPEMGMSGATYRAREVSRGTYSADVVVATPTLWDFVVHAEIGSEYGTALYEARIAARD